MLFYFVSIQSYAPKIMSQKSVKRVKHNRSNPVDIRLETQKGFNPEISNLAGFFKYSDSGQRLYEVIRFAKPF